MNIRTLIAGPAFVLIGGMLCLFLLTPPGLPVTSPTARVAHQPQTFGWNHLMSETVELYAYWDKTEPVRLVVTEEIQEQATQNTYLFEPCPESGYKMVVRLNKLKPEARYTYFWESIESNMLPTKILLGDFSLSDPTIIKL